MNDRPAEHGPTMCRSYRAKQTTMIVQEDSIEKGPVPFSYLKKKQKPKAAVTVKSFKPKKVR